MHAICGKNIKIHPEGHILVVHWSIVTMRSHTVQIKRNLTNPFNITSNRMVWRAITDYFPEYGLKVLL